MKSYRKGIRILFYIPEGNISTNGVYASQCFEFARYLVRSQLAECAILHYEEKKNSTQVKEGPLRRKFFRLMRLIREFFSKNSFIDKQKLEEGIVLYIDTKARRTIPIFRKIGFFKGVARRVAPIIQDFRPTHIYCRSYQTAQGASYLSHKFDAKMIYSIRGEDVSEKRCLGGMYNFMVSFWVRHMVMKAIKLADHINTVSRAFHEWLKDEYGCDSSVTPCCVSEKMFVVDASRAEIRRELGFSETDKVLVYCGGMWPWLCVDEMVKMMRLLCESCNDIRVLFIVKDEQSVRNVCKKAGLSTRFWRVHSCKPGEVGMYMRTGDVGIILLRGDIRDRVCSPVKVGEYLASGLGVIAPDCTGDFSKDAKDESFYCKYNGCREVNVYKHFISEISDDIRVKARQFAHDNYTWSANLFEIKKMLS